MASQDVWRSVRLAYEAGAPVAEIVKRFKVSAGTVYNRASAEKWVRNRETITEEVTAQVEAELPAAIAARLTDQIADLAVRQSADLQELWSRITHQIEALHTEQTREVPTKAGPCEIRLGAIDRLAGLQKAAQALGQAQAAIRKAMGLDKEQPATVAPDQKPVVVVPPDSDDWAKLVERRDDR